MRQVNVQLWNKRGLNVINAHERGQSRYLEGLKEANAAVVQGRINPQPFFCLLFPKKQYSKLFEVQQQKP